MTTGLIITLANGTEFNVKNMDFERFLSKVHYDSGWLKFTAENTDAKHKSTLVNPAYVLSVREVDSGFFGNQSKTWILS